MDLDRTWGGLRVVHPTTGDDSGFYKATPTRSIATARRSSASTPSCCSSSAPTACTSLTTPSVLERHAERRAEATVVTTTTTLEEASRLGTVTVAGEGRVTGFDYKPDHPSSQVVTTEVFVYDAHVLLRTLAELEAEGEELSDFGHSLLPRLVERGQTWAHDLDGDWQDVGTLESYWQAHMELLEPEPQLQLDDPEWPILTRASQRPPARIEKPGSVDTSLISPGCTVRGAVVRSVLGPGVVVEKGVSVVDSVVLGHSQVRANIERAIVDLGADVVRKATGGDEPTVVA